MSKHLHMSGNVHEVAHCDCPGCAQAEDEMVGTLVEYHARDKAAMVRMGFDAAEGRSRVEKAARAKFKTFEARRAAEADIDADERIDAAATFGRALVRALDVLYPPA